MPRIEITAVDDVGDDVLRVTFTVDGASADPAGNVYQARGWVSATTNHYDAGHYREHAIVGGQWAPVDEHTPTDAVRDVHRDASATPRAMTPAEVGDYARSLIYAQWPVLEPEHARPAPRPVDFA